MDRELEFSGLNEDVSLEELVEMYAEGFGLPVSREYIREAGKRIYEGLEPQARRLDGMMPSMHSIYEVALRLKHNAN